MRCLLCDFQNEHNEELKIIISIFIWTTKTITFLKNYLPLTGKINTIGGVTIVKLVFKVVEKNHCFSMHREQAGGANKHL